MDTDTPMGGGGSGDVVASGHCGLSKHLHIITKAASSACPACRHDEETVSHFLGQCPATARLRGHHFQDYYISVN